MGTKVIKYYSTCNPSKEVEPLSELIRDIVVNEEKYIRMFVIGTKQFGYKFGDTFKPSKPKSVLGFIEQIIESPNTKDAVIALARKYVQLMQKHFAARFAAELRDVKKHKYNNKKYKKARNELFKKLRLNELLEKLSNPVSTPVASGQIRRRLI